MGLKYSNFFEGSNYESSDTQIIICKNCSSHLCLSHLILSDEFRGSSGPAYLVDKLINYLPDPDLEETVMQTGTYVIRKVRCHQCSCRLGWTYKKSFSYSQTYKEGKFVIEKKYIRMIPNNSSIGFLMERVRSNNRRRSSGASSRSSIDTSYKDGIMKDDTKGACSLKIGSMSDITAGVMSGQDRPFMSRIRFQGIDKEDSEGDSDIFVNI